MEQTTLEEVYGRLLLSDLFTSVWFGHWQEYENVITKLPEALIDDLPFHKYYDSKETAIWRDNYFQIPGPYFIPPYLSSYFGESEEEQEEARHNILCLVGEFDKLGFYYPLEQDEFPDHFGSMTAFFTAALKEEINAIHAEDTEKVKELKIVQSNIYNIYLAKGADKMLVQCEKKLTDSFFKEFIPFYVENMKVIAT